MKSKGGSLYEVLKSASRPAGADEGAPTSPETPAAPASEGAQPTLQERLAAYKAAKLAAATQPAPASAPAPEPPKPSSATLILEPDPTPVPAPSVTRLAPPPPAPAPVASAPEPATVETPAKGLGERVVTLTYNTVLFGGMVAVGLLFIAYAVGLHVGKGNAAAELQSAAAEVRPAPKPAPVFVPQPPPPPPPPRKEYTIRLGEWKLVTAQDRLKALALAEDPELKKTLERAGHRNFVKAGIQRGNEQRMALYVGVYGDPNSDAAKSALTAMKTFKWKGQTPFSQAAIEEAPPR